MMGSGSLEARYTRPACAQTTLARSSVGSAPDEPVTRRRTKSAATTAPPTDFPVSLMTRPPVAGRVHCVRSRYSHIRTLLFGAICVKLDTQLLRPHGVNLVKRFVCSALRVGHGT